MSKQDEVVSAQNEDLPPPYSTTNPTTNPSLQSVSAILSANLRDLPYRITSVQAARSSERDERDGEILTILTPHVEDMIQSIAMSDTPQRQIEMTMVPENAVGDDWKYSDEDHARTIVKVGEAKMKGDTKQSKPKAPPPQRVFDEWGRWEDGPSETTQDALWWSDDQMASRLAKYLQPERPRPAKAPPVVQQLKQVKKSGWGLFKKNPQPVTTPIPTPVPRNEEEPVSMTVKAEEVTFRRENEMGIWESKTGWGLVVRIRVRQ